MEKVLVCGAGGFIGHHLVKALKKQGHWVRGVDLKDPEFEATDADHFIKGDLRVFETCKKSVYLDDSCRESVDTIYQLAKKGINNIKSLNFLGLKAISKELTFCSSIDKLSSLFKLFSKLLP